MNRLLPLLAIMALVLASVSVAHAQTTTPTVSTVAVTSDPGTDDTYALGDTIEVGLTFDEAVTVAGAPYLLIDVGGNDNSTWERQANWCVGRRCKSSAAKEQATPRRSASRARVTARWTVKRR